MFLQILCVLVLWTKVASALEELSIILGGYIESYHAETKWFIYQVNCSYHVNGSFMKWSLKGKCQEGKGV